MPAIAAKPKRTTARSNTSVVARCQHLRSDGKRCADAVYPGHASLCHHHLGHQLNSRPRGIAGGDIIAADILHAIGNFQSAAAINVALGKILIYQLTGRLSRQDALALSYQCQLLLQTLPLIQKELKETGFSKYWCEETRRILGESSDLDQLTFSSLLPESEFPLHPKTWVDPKLSTPKSNPPQSTPDATACATAPPPSASSQPSLAQANPARPQQPLTPAQSAPSSAVAKPANAMPPSSPPQPPPAGL